jgi:hypothetical protein
MVRIIATECYMRIKKMLWLGEFSHQHHTFSVYISLTRTIVVCIL